MVIRGSLASYETVWKDEPLETRDIAIPEGQPFHFAKRLDFGRYRIEVAQTDGMAVTSYRFRSGWASSDSPDVPDRIDVSADRKSVPIGQSVHVHIAPPFAGEATYRSMRVGDPVPMWPFMSSEEAPAPNPVERWV
jgi:uncharacterized protein YfaS (alpha-2-macroglobulin family)